LKSTVYLDPLLLDDAAAAFVVVVEVHRLPVSGAAVIVVIRSEESRPESRIKLLKILVKIFHILNLEFFEMWVLAGLPDDTIRLGYPYYF
jgi:hypothetical protein